MNAVLALALEEFREGLRNRWVVGAIILFATLSLSLAFLGSTPVGELKVSRLAVTVVSLASLSVYLVPLIALALSFDTLVGERERGTLLLLLTYPVARWQVVIGKYLGQVLILGLAIALGYGCAGLVLALVDDETAGGWRAYGAMMVSSWLLGCVFAALGCLISALVRQRATAMGLAIGLWLAMVLVYDLTVLGLLMADTEQRLSAPMFSALMTLNPADAYRVFNLTTLDGSALVSGVGTLGAQSSPSTGLLLGSLVIWTILPLLAALFVFKRQEL
jgi:Cu-processing system permease protein